LYVDVVAITTGTAAGDDYVGVELIDHALGTKGGINLADTTFLHSYVVLTEELLQLTQLLVHCYNNTNLHITFYYLWCKDTKKLEIRN
jgi:hypothetical protein